jgi:hypothetical protein
MVLKQTTALSSGSTLAHNSNIYKIDDVLNLIR